MGNKATNKYRLLFKDKKLLKKLGIVSIVTFFLSLYIFAMLAFTLSNMRFSLNPIEYIVHFTKNGGFSFTIFLLLFAVIEWIVIAGMANAAEALRMDERNFEYSKSGIYGTAGVMTDDELSDVAKVQTAAEAEGTIFGQYDKTGTKVINSLQKSRLNKHVMVMGASQSGKTYSYAMPFCFQAAKRRESLIVTDPKGELYEDTAEYFRNKGYIVRRFDLKNPELSDGWACLKELRGDEMRAQVFSQVVIQNTSDGKRGGDPIYEQGPMQLLKALLLRIERGDDFEDIDIPPSQRIVIKDSKDNKVTPLGVKAIGTVIELLENGDEAALDALFAAENMPNKGARISCAPYKIFKGASPNLRGNLITGLGTRIQILQNEIIKKMTSINDIDLSLPGKKPCVYYCIMSDQHSTMNFLTALFFAFLFIDLVEYADAQPDRKCKVPVNFLLDEFANIGAIPDFDKKIATVRSRDINISIIVQDINQLRNKYFDTYQSIMSNCSTHLCIGFNDAITQEYYSERSGEATVRTNTEQHPEKDPLIKIGLKHSTGDGRRTVFTSDELARMDKDKCLIVFQGHNALMVYKFGYPLHPEANLLRRISCETAIPISDQKARGAYRRIEEERVRKYEEWLENGAKANQRPPVPSTEDLVSGNVSLGNYCEEIEIAFDEDEIVWDTVITDPVDKELIIRRKTTGDEFDDDEEEMLKNEDNAGITEKKREHKTIPPPSPQTEKIANKDIRKESGHGIPIKKKIQK